MKKYILISLISVACLLSASATPYSQSRMTKTSVRGSRTSITYGRHSLGIGRQTMDMSNRRMELKRSSDGLQSIQSNGNNYSGYSRTAPASAPRSGSIYSMTDRPGQVSAYQPHAVTVQRSSASRHEIVSGWEPETRRYQVVSSSVGIESLFQGVSSGGGSSSNVSYGRTSNGESSISHTLASFSGTARPTSMASTIGNQQTDGDPQTTIQQFGENPEYDSAPLGDALLPLLLLISLLAIYKSRKTHI